MKKIEAIIFDMDGTLYSFDEKDETQFGSSEFGKQIQSNCLRFFRERFSLSEEGSLKMYTDLQERYNGQVSLAVEKEFGIDRSEYFASTWDLPVERFITPNLAMVQILERLTLRSGVLTAAPRVWADKVLNYLLLKEFFAEAVFTGDPDLRKPDPEAFLQLARFWSLAPSQILSIGDQESTDIVPARSVGMKTLRIAKRAETQADFMAPDVIAAIALLQEKGIV